MLVFIDESGDPGFALTRGSSRYFVIVCVIFHDELEAEKMAVTLKELRRNLGLSHESEFKFNKSRKKVRVAFLRTLQHFNFSVRALVIDKTLIRSTRLQ